MKRIVFIAYIVLGVLLLSACNLPNQGEPKTTPTVGFEEKVAQTLTAISQEKLLTPSQTVIPSAPTSTSEPTATPTATNTIAPTITFTPSKTKAPTQTNAPTKTPIPKPGTIEGNISGYPYGSLPSLAIVAFKQEAPYNYSYWITAPGSSHFSMTSDYLIPGKYLVVAYDADGNSGGCPDLVTVKSEETVSCNITDWASSYPAKPATVPGP
jgi:hypothetical protein